MKLLYSATSPYVRKVDVLLREAGLRDAVETSPASGTPLDPNPDAVTANPLGKVPALIRDDGATIYDSRVICSYIDRLAGGRFYPASSEWEVRTLEATADGILDAALLMVYERRLRPEEMVFEPWVEGQWGKITRALDGLEARWMSHLKGPVTMGQIAVGCALGYLDLRFGERNWRDGRPALAGWFESFAERPSMQATVPQG